jgi:membrane-associated phospholipid phosphatase
MGALGLVGLVPLARAERVRARPAGPANPPIRRLTAVMPVFRSARVGAVAAETLRHVDDLVLVDDGSPPEIAALLDDAARDPRVHVVRLGANQGKGSAVAAGIRVALEGAPDAVIVLDSDGQHPAELIPEFIAAADHADVVVGDRRRARPMPLSRRLANGASTWMLTLLVRSRLRDSQNGMRLLRTSALRDVPPPDGRYEAETRHLKALVRGGHSLAWVPVPVIYEGEPSSFRPLADTLRVARAVLAPAARRPAQSAAGAATLRGATREWGARIALGMLLAWTVAAALPLLAPLDEGLFLAINGLGDGPGWLYDALDPHSRNYLLLAAAATLAVLLSTRRLRFAGGALLTMALAGVLADLVLEVVQLGVDRPRPEEALGAEALRSHDRHWSHIPSFPSGHLIVSTALVVAALTMAPVLRIPALVYLAAIAVTRITFGAHFPLDVVVGTVIGWQVGLASVAVARAGRLLPRAARSRARRRVPIAIDAPMMLPRPAPTSTSSQK